MKNLNKKIKLLSPAGSFESLNAAIKAGADAVYFGAGNLNMRSRSSYNFSMNDIIEVVKLCSKNSVESYLTLNTIIYDEDIEEAVKTLEVAKSAGISAVIASDIAIIRIAHEMNITVHISVQANVCNVEAVKFYSQFADVMVLARELNIKQIAKITSAIEGDNGNSKILGPTGKPVKIEIFAHGALCVSVSGKCYMSLAKYNSSANRGACYQNCRRSYRVIDETDGSELIVDNKYIMSPKDICLIKCLDKIIDAGTSILKIEGRGRSADYVYTVTDIYRKALNALEENSYTSEKTEEWEKELKTVFNRDFWHGGYYLGESLDIWSGNANNQATKKKTRIGIVNKFYSKINVAELDLKEGDVSVGDEIVIIGSTTGVEKTIIKEIRFEEKTVNSAKKGDIVSIPFPLKVRKNDKVYLLTEN